MLQVGEWNKAVSEVVLKSLLNLSQVRAIAWLVLIPTVGGVPVREGVPTPLFD